MNKVVDKELVKEIGVDAGSSVIGATSGLLIAGPPGAILGAIVTPVAGNLLKRVLTKNEKSRIQKTVELSSQKYQENIRKGAGLRKDIDLSQFQQLTEGILLKAKDTYEEKKIPYIAYLLANAPFTNTPIDNLNQSLLYAEQLSYRQLCLIALIGNGWGKKVGLTDKPLIKQDKKRQLDEKIEGVYSDLNHLLVLGIIGQLYSKDSGPAVASGMYLISPANLELLYPGTLLYNGMLLGTIDVSELDAYIKVLSD